MKTLFKSAFAAVLAIIVFQSCHHADAPLPFPGNYMIKMGGQRHWHVFDTSWASPPGSAPNRDVKTIDDNFALTVNTADSTVYCPKNYSISLGPAVEGKHKFCAFDSVSHTMTFQAIYLTNLGTYIQIPFGDYIVYHYDVNNIEIFAEDHGIYAREHVYLKSE